MQEIISVIVPVYNVEKYVEKCIDSILNQTYKNLEIILINDGSKDKSGEICDEYAKKDSRIKVIHKENGGLSDARNTGIESASGDYFAFIDSDDYIDTYMLESLHKEIVKHRADMSICNYCHVDEDGNILSLNEQSLINDNVIEGKDIFKEFISSKHTIYSIACNKLYKRELFDDVRYPVGKIHEDEFVAHKLLGKCNLISCIKEPMYYYLQRAGSIAHSEFSIKKMDAAEALLDRTEYAINNKFDILAEKSFRDVVGYLVQGYKNLDFKDEKTEYRMKELKCYFDRLYPKAIKVVHSYMWKCLLSLFKINPKSYVKLYDLKKR